SRRTGTLELRAHVLLVQLLDRIPVQMQFLGDVLDRRRAAAPAHVVREALGIERIVGQKLQPLALHRGTLAAANPAHFQIEVNAQRHTEYRAGAASCRPPLVSIHVVLPLPDTSSCGVCPPVRLAIDPLCTSRCPQSPARPLPVRQHWLDNTGTRTRLRPCDTTCRTKDKTDSQALPSLSPATPPVASEHFLEVDLTRFGGQFVVSLSDSLPSSNV